MSKYLAFAQSAFLTGLAYRGQVWASIFGRLVQVFAWMSMWMAVYQGRGSVEGVDIAEMMTYAVLGTSVMAAWDWRRILNLVGDSVQTGDVAVYLLKPLSYPAFLLSQEVGTLGFRLAFTALPVVIVVALTYGMVPPASAAHGAAFLALYAISFLIMFLFATLFGLLSFWLMTAFSLEWLLQGVLMLAAGTAIPLWFFPAPLAAVIEMLPFAWVGYHPLAVYLGKVAPAEALQLIAMGAGWVVVLALATYALWRRATLRITVQGG